MMKRTLIRFREDFGIINMAVFVFASLIVGAELYAQEGLKPSQDVQTPFNVSEVIEQVSHHPVLEGDRIVIKDQAYEASFNDQGVLLKARVTKGDAKDLVIPLAGSPEIREGKVVYHTEQGEIFFEGHSRGLRFKQVGGREVPLTYSGNVAKLTSSHSESSNSPQKTLPAGEFLIDTNVVYVTAGGEQTYPSIAFDGTNYLVVWQDFRNCGSDGNEPASDGPDIYGTRVSQSGVVLDSTGIPISTALYGQYSPSIAFDGTNYLVVWADFRNPTLDIYGSRVSPSGTILDPSGIAISTAAFYQSFPKIAFDGTNYLVIWQDWRNPTWDIYGARVNQSGTVLDPSGIAISAATNNQTNPSIAFDGTNYLAVWMDKRGDGIYGGLYPDIYSARVTPSGSVLDPSGISISIAAYGQYSPSIAFDDTNYLVVWHDNRGGLTDIVGARVNQSGAILDPTGVAISTAASYQISPSIAFDGTNYLVVWEDFRNPASPYSDVYGARVNRAGIVLDPGGIAISTAPYWKSHPSIAFDGTNYLVVWQDYRSGSDWNIYGSRINQSGTVLDPSGIAISTAANWQRYPSVAFDGSNYLVVWMDERNNRVDIYGARVTRTGTVLDPSGIAISTAGYEWYPSIAFGDTNYFVVWNRWRNLSFDIYGARMTRAGTILDTSGLAISTALNNQNNPSIAFDGINYLVVWEDLRSGSSIDLYGAKVNATGGVVDSFAVSLQSGDQITPGLAHGAGSQYLIAYSGFCDKINNRPANTMRIWGKFYLPSGIEEARGMKPEAGYRIVIYPNPFTGKTTINYQLTGTSPVSLKVFNISGQLVKVLVDEPRKAGAYQAVWDGRDEKGKRVPTGVYFCRLQAAEFSATRKVILTR